MVMQEAQQSRYALSCRSFSLDFLIKTYEKQLKDQCKEEWHNGRQLCEVRSLTDRHCVHKWHRLPGEAGEGLIMPHNSRTKSLTASTCGEIQVQRDDPFTLEEANFMFYNDLESKLHVKEGKIIFDTYNAESAQLQEVLSHLKVKSLARYTRDVFYKVRRAEIATFSFSKE
jgi:hypothetical protein